MRHWKLIKVCATFKQYLLLQLFQLSLQAELISQYNGKWPISLFFVQNRWYL